jgi:DNA-binding winged helix-turn-helix (wHTH) protein/TolB-like protein/Tfp pilus assembly protein PilF
MDQTGMVGFGGWRLDRAKRCLWRPDGVAEALPGRAFDVLCHLVEQRPEVVSKDALIAAVWPGRVVEENNLTQAISALRRAFDRGANDRDFILTVAGRGYAFVAAVDDVHRQRRRVSDYTPDPPPVGESGSGDPPSLSPVPAPVRAAWRRRAAWGLAIAVVSVLALGIAVMRRDLAPADRAHGTKPPADALQAQSTLASSADDHGLRTLAVLPFRTLDTGKPDPLLELGIPDTLITRLSGSPQWRVLSLAATQAYRGQAADPIRTGASLGADYIVEGNVQRAAGKLRVTARLLRLSDGRAVWTDSLDTAPAALLAAEDRLASSIAAVLMPTLAPTPTPHRYSSACDGADQEAYRAYLRGRFIANRPDPRTLDSAIAEFRLAIQRDPRCARAWAAMAFTRRALVMVADHDPKVEFPKAKREVARALALDPRSAEAYAAQGFVQFWYDWDWAGAERSLRHAIELDPNLAEAHFVLAHLLINIGRNDEGIVEAHRASVLDPLSPIINVIVAGFYSANGDQAEAERRIDQVLAVEPDFWAALWNRSVFRRLKGDLAGSRRDIDRAVAVTGANAQSLFNLALYDVRTGDADAARQILARLRARQHRRYVPASTIASIELLLGERQAALDSLELGYRQKDIGMAFLRVWFSGLSGEPRYHALMRRMDLPLPSSAPQALPTTTARAAPARPALGDAEPKPALRR